MTYGECRVTVLDTDGRASVQDVKQGDLWFFPAGYSHSLQGLGSDGCEFVIVFDDGRADWSGVRTPCRNGSGPRNGPLADADTLRKTNAGWLVAHVRTIRKIVRAEAPREQLVHKAESGHFGFRVRRKPAPLQKLTFQRGEEALAHGKTVPQRNE
jgi:hypothetical protein